MLSKLACLVEGLFHERIENKTKQKKNPKMTKNIEIQ